METLVYIVIGNLIVVAVLLVALLIYTIRVYERVSSGGQTSTNVEDNAISAVTKQEPPVSQSRHGKYRMFGMPIVKDLGQGVPDLATATSEDERDAQQWAREHGEKDDE